ncbi:hypothetical protein [Dyella tabacisoli]|uniref:Uncharacterized protein n=1 Tax=Dyella tabacisoli TaxID=2282381 RepID=A0A369URX3_9GAMM|nr:hypothetical protein [Dyella tabacisoli]RDD83063.1 hypothetical protein DVJ77_00085 [Dyella tabacisoli]
MSIDASTDIDTDTSAAIPCIELKALSGIPTIPLLGGAELNAFVDLASGPTSDCKLNLNLLIQLGPLFASMACLFKILNVISKIKDFASAVPDPTKLATSVPKLLDAIAQLEGCIPALQIPNLIAMLKHILLLIINILLCFLTQVDSILKFKLSINMDGTDDNPVLKDTLICASNSADAAMSNAMSSLKPLQSLMMIIGIIAGLTGQSLDLPDFSAIAGGANDIEKTVSSIKSAVQGLKGIVDSLPG